MASLLPLRGITVVEHGERLAVRACAMVLEALGARVVRPPVDVASARYGASIDAADVVITSSDLSPVAVTVRGGSQVVCDITAYGGSGPLAGLAHSDALVQAMSGLADTTGEPDGPPALCGFPIAEGIGALYAAAGIVAALQVRALHGKGQGVEVALFDCAFSTLTTFLPFHFIGKAVTRAGNRHVLASPWNTYLARDGWLIICTATDEQWRRLCRVIGRLDLATDPRLANSVDRQGAHEVVDGAVQAWIANREATQAAEALQAEGVAAGPIVAVSALAEEPNLRHRKLWVDGRLASAIRYVAPAAAAARPVDVAAVEWPVTDHPVAGLPLAGLKVLEIGQYTTAPLVARHLGALGADVLKIEPPSGDGSRAWPPQQHGQGYFFSLSNSDKRSLCLDLRERSERAHFAGLLRVADVLVENMKPGSLDKLGFGAPERAALNPRLVYCAISGFGADSAYPGRPAFDTVVQAMSGIMDLIRVNGVPQKAGISLADVLGGSFGLIGTLAALLAREGSGQGASIDISMQDAGAWITQWSAGGKAPGPEAAVLRCADGYVVAQTSAAGVPLESDATRTALIEHLRALGIPAAPVLSIGEVATHPQTRARSLLVDAHDSAGRAWPQFNCPIRLAATPARIRSAIGPLGETKSGTDHGFP